jgi:hypothetical protein
MYVVLTKMLDGLAVPLRTLYYVTCIDLVFLSYGPAYLF